MYQYFIPFYCCVVFHCVNILQFFNPMNRIFETRFLGDRKCYICSPTGVGAFDQEALGVAPLCLRCPGGGAVLVCWARFFSDGSFREGWPLSVLFVSIQWPFRSPRLSFLVVSFFSEFLTLTLWGGRGGDKGWGGVAGPLSPPWSMPFPLINLLLFCTTSAPAQEEILTMMGLQVRPWCS